MGRVAFRKVMKMGGNREDGRTGICVIKRRIR